MNEPKFKLGDAVEFTIRASVRDICLQDDGSIKYYVKEMEPHLQKYNPRAFYALDNELVPLPMPVSDNSVGQ